MPSRAFVVLVAVMTTMVALLVTAAVVYSQTTPPPPPPPTSCTPPQVLDPGPNPPTTNICYTPLPPEYTPLLVVYTPPFDLNGQQAPPGTQLTYELYQGAGPGQLIVRVAAAIVRNSSLVRPLAAGACFLVLPTNAGSAGANPASFTATPPDFAGLSSISSPTPPGCATPPATGTANVTIAFQ